MPPGKRRSTASLIMAELSKVLIYLVNLFLRIFIILETMPFSSYSQNLLTTTIFLVGQSYFFGIIIHVITGCTGSA